MKRETHAYRGTLEKRARRTDWQAGSVYSIAADRWQRITLIE
jgi:hypothetical protein